MDAFAGITFQHVGSRFTQPGDQENNPRTFVHGLPFGGAPADASTPLDLKLPDYQLVNISAGVEMANQLEIVAYIHNLFDEHYLLPFSRERGRRAPLVCTPKHPDHRGLPVPPVL